MVSLVNLLVFSEKIDFSRQEKVSVMRSIVPDGKQVKERIFKVAWGQRVGNDRVGGCEGLKIFFEKK